MKRRNELGRTALFGLLLTAAVLSAQLAVSGQQQDPPLAEGPGAELVKAKCSLCHELGHITRTRQTREEWADTVRTMINRGAPVTEAEAAVIVDYCVKFYGK